MHIPCQFKMYLFKTGSTVSVDPLIRPCKISAHIKNLISNIALIKVYYMDGRTDKRIQNLMAYCSNEVQGL